MARPLTFTPAEFAEAVEAYFRGISYEMPVVTVTPDGEDEHGKPRWVRQVLTDEAGEPVTERRWIKPPSLAGLCLHLGIVRDTWARYGKKLAYRETVELARLTMEDYWAGQLAGKSAKGAAFALENNYGWSGVWRSRQEIGVDEPTRKALSVEGYLRQEAKKEGGGYEY